MFPSHDRLQNSSKKLTIETLMAMRKTLLILGISLAALTCGIAQNFIRPWRIVWDDPNPTGTVMGYRIYRQTNPTNWVTVTNTVAKEWPVNLSPGVHTLAVTAFGTNGLESAASESLPVGVLLAVVNIRVVQ